MNQLSAKKILEKKSPWVSRSARKLVWRLHPVARMSRAWLSRHHDVYRGKRCVIIGNGPSLNKMDLSPLKHEITFSMNRGYLLHDRIGATSTFHVVVNPLVARQWRDELSRVEAEILSTWERRHEFNQISDMIYVGGPAWDDTPRFSTDVREDLWQGATVTYVALQLAYFLGFQTVYLIGVDHRFRTKGPPHKTIRARGDDVDHFDPNYFGKGVEWQLPDLETSELAYTLARYYFNLAERKILDATLDGALTVFPKVDYDEVFS